MDQEKCLIKVGVLKETSSEGTKVKVIGITVSAFNTWHLEEIMSKGFGDDLEERGKSG